MLDVLFRGDGHWGKKRACKPLFIGWRDVSVGGRGKGDTREEKSEEEPPIKHFIIHL